MAGFAKHAVRSGHVVRVLADGGAPRATGTGGMVVASAGARIRGR